MLPTVQTLEVQRALLLFYDLLPEQAWERGKPSSADLLDWLDEAQDYLPAETLSVIDALQAEANTNLRTEAAQWLLQGFQGNAVLRPYVDRALSAARQAGPVAGPNVIGGLIAALAVLPRVDPKTKAVGQEWHIRWNPSECAAKLAGGLSSLAKAMPSRILDAAIQSAEAPPQPWPSPAPTLPAPRPTLSVAIARL